VLNYSADSEPCQQSLELGFRVLLIRLLLYFSQHELFVDLSQRVLECHVLDDG